MVFERADLLNKLTYGNTGKELALLRYQANYNTDGITYMPIVEHGQVLILQCLLKRYNVSGLLFLGARAGISEKSRTCKIKIMHNLEFKKCAVRVY